MESDSIFDYDSESAARVAVDFRRGDPMDVFSRIEVYAEFDSPGMGRHPVARAVPGYPGRWVLAYSSLRRLRMACHDDEIEYSWLTGARLLEAMPTQTGVWFDRSFPGGRPILMPPPSLSVDTG